MAVKCEVCEKADSWDTKYGTGIHKTQLLGGFLVDICNKCRNEWHEHVHATELLFAYADFVTHTETLRIAGKVKKLKVALKVRHEKQVAAYEVAKAWVNDHPKLAEPTSRAQIEGPIDDVEDESDES